MKSLGYKTKMLVTPAPTMRIRQLSYDICRLLICLVGIPKFSHYSEFRDSSPGFKTLFSERRLLLKDFLQPQLPTVLRL